MSRTRSVLAVVFATSALIVVPVGSASAHVHGINPLRCTPAPPNAGANQTNSLPEQSATLPFVGAIPISMGGNVEPRPLEFFGVCRNGS